MMVDDTELLRRYVLEHSEAAFAELVQRHLALVYFAALRRLNGDASLAEEVAQAVFTALARQAAALQRHPALSGWLYTATRHAAANVHRSEHRRKIREQEASTMHEPSPATQADAEWAQLRPEIDSVLDELSDADRTAVLLRFFENRPYPEIGARLRISGDAARMRVDRALEKMHALLGRRGITSTAVALGGLLAAQASVAAPAGLAGTVTATAIIGTASSAGAAGTLAFMATNKLALGLTGFALLLGGAALQQKAQADNASAALSAVEARATSLQAKLAEEEKLVLAAEDRIQAAEAKLAADAAAKLSAKAEPVVAAVAKEKSGPPLSRADRHTQMMANPEYYDLQMKIAERGLRLQFGPLYRKLGWGSDKIKEFERLKLKQMQTMFDVMAAATLNGVSMGSSGLQKQWSDAEATADRVALDALLGPDIATYREFSDVRMLSGRGPVETLAGNLYYTAQPLSADQAERLLKVIVDRTPKSQPVNGVLTANTPNWTDIYAAAAGVLAPEQLEIFRAVSERNELFLQANTLEAAAPRN